MVLTVDQITTMNFILCIVIVALSIMAYRKAKGSVHGSFALYIGFAFGLFGISHLVTLLGYAEALTTPLIVIRTIAYLTIIYALLSTKKP